MTDKELDKIAKVLRSNYPMHGSANIPPYVQERRLIEDIACQIANELFPEKPGFDPLAFLDKCSPNTELYPFTEIWEEEWVNVS
jgi:hypothetical protein